MVITLKFIHFIYEHAFIDNPSNECVDFFIYIKRNSTSLVNCYSAQQDTMSLLRAPFIYCLLTGVVCTVAVLEFGELSSNEFESRLINGTNATHHQFPHQVSLQLLSGRHFCSGAILNSYWVITAAQCVVALKPEAFAVVIGAHYVANDGIPYPVRDVVVHPQFKSDSFLSDIALIRVQFRILLFTPFVRAIQLPKDDTERGEAVLVSGWGASGVRFQSHHTVFTLIEYICFACRCLIAVLSIRRHCNIYA